MDLFVLLLPPYNFINLHWQNYLSPFVDKTLLKLYKQTSNKIVEAVTIN